MAPAAPTSEASINQMIKFNLSTSIKSGENTLKLNKKNTNKFFL